MSCFKHVVTLTPMGKMKACQLTSIQRSSLSAEYISLLFTDLGVLTPAAVSDELIQLYV